MSNSEWGAIPRSLANDVSNMIEKKMGTSSGYKPVEWVSQINLMGKLPIKTASGAIASFSDGADGVPVKSCSVSFLPSGGGGTPSAPVAISGVSGLSVTQLGKNLFDKTSVANDKYLSTTTGLEEPAINYCVSDYIPVFSGVTVYIPASQTARRWFYDKNKTPTTYLSNSGNQAYTPSADGYIRVSILKTQIDLDTYQIEVGSTATTYSAYVTPSVVTDTFGQTIYGGTRDLTTDKASVTYALLELAVADMNNSDNYPGWKNSGIKALIGADKGSISVFYVSVGNALGVNTNGSNDICFLPKASYGNMTQTEWKTNYPDLVIQIAVPLDTPTELTGLTPHEIDTLYGDNNIYADTGTTTVEYRADIDLALNA